MNSRQLKFPDCKLDPQWKKKSLTDLNCTAVNMILTKSDFMQDLASSLIFLKNKITNILHVKKALCLHYIMKINIVLPDRSTRKKLFIAAVKEKKSLCVSINFYQNYFKK